LRSPVRSFPRPVSPFGSEIPWASPRASHPAVASGACQGREQASDTSLSLTATQPKRPRVAPRITSVYVNAGAYHLPVAGATHLDSDKPGSGSRFSAYRFHEDDPIPFRAGLRLVWRNGEELGGHRFGNPMPTTLTSYARAYEW